MQVIGNRLSVKSEPAPEPESEPGVDSSLDRINRINGIWKREPYPVDPVNPVQNIFSFFLKEES